MSNKQKEMEIHHYSEKITENNPFHVESDLDEKEWFFLYWIGLQSYLTKESVNTPELIEKLQISQQTISRRIIELEKKGYISRTFRKLGGELSLTSKGMESLRNVQNILDLILNSREVFDAKLVSGMGEGAYYIKQEGYFQQFIEKLGYTPYFGTFNIILDAPRYEELLYELKRFNPVEIKGFSNGDRTYGSVFCYRSEIWPKDHEEKRVPCAILKIQRTSHQPNVLEIIAEQCLRDFFQLKDQDEMQFRLISI